MSLKFKHFSNAEKVSSRAVCWIQRMTSLYCNPTFKTRRRQHWYDGNYNQRPLVISCHDNDISLSLNPEVVPGVFLLWQSANPSSPASIHWTWLLYFCSVASTVAPCLNPITARPRSTLSWLCRRSCICFRELWCFVIVMEACDLCCCSKKWFVQLHHTIVLFSLAQGAFGRWQHNLDKIVIETLL